MRSLIWILSLVSLAGTGCSSSDDDANGAGGTGGSAGAGSGPTRNVYVNQVGTSGGCLPRPLETGPDGRVSCPFVEARLQSGAACPACDANPGRTALEDTASVVPAVQEYMRNIEFCDAAGQPACSDYCYCALQQFSGAELLTCESAATDPGTQYGLCYVDPTVDVNGDGAPDANPVLLADCEASEQRKLRFMGADVPASDGFVFLACPGATATN